MYLFTSANLNRHMEEICLYLHDRQASLNGSAVR